MESWLAAWRRSSVASQWQVSEKSGKRAVSKDKEFSRRKGLIADQFYPRVFVEMLGAVHHVWKSSCSLQLFAFRFVLAARLSCVCWIMISIPYPYCPQWVPNSLYVYILLMRCLKLLYLSLWCRWISHLMVWVLEELFLTFVYARKYMLCFYQEWIIVIKIICADFVWKKCHAHIVM
jgi:hypothetical protein